MSFFELLLLVIGIPILYVVLLFIFSFVEEYIKLKKEYAEEEDDDWIFPVQIKYNLTKTQYYAWDIDDVFLGQSENVDDLLTIVGERWNIPYENMVIRSETELNEKQPTE
jgi:hypothetical protein